ATPANSPRRESAAHQDLAPVPRSKSGTTVRRHIARDDLRRAARDADFIEMVRGEETNPLTVGRPERSTGAVGAGHRLRELGRQWPKPELPASVRLHAHVHEVPAIRGQGERNIVA